MSVVLWPHQWSIFLNGISVSLSSRCFQTSAQGCTETVLIEQFHTLFACQSLSSLPDVNAGFTLEPKRQAGFTLLHLAAMLDFARLTRFLVECRAGRTLPEWLDRELDPATRDACHRSLATLSCLRNSHKTVSYLLTLNVDDFVNVDACYGKLPLILAFERGNTDLVVEVCFASLSSWCSMSWNVTG